MEYKNLPRQNYSEFNNPLINAINNNDYNKVKHLCDKTPELIGIVDKYNISPLLYAVEKKYISIVYLLCKRSCCLSKIKNCDINNYTSIPGIIGKEEEYDGQIPGKDINYNFLVTPLMLAVIKQNISIIIILLKYTNVNYRHIIKRYNYNNNNLNNFTVYSSSNMIQINEGVNALFYAVKIYLHNLNLKLSIRLDLNKCMRIIKILLDKDASPMYFIYYNNVDANLNHISDLTQYDKFSKNKNDNKYKNENYHYANFKNNINKLKELNELLKQKINKHYNLMRSPEITIEQNPQRLSNPSFESKKNGCTICGGKK